MSYNGYWEGGANMTNVYKTHELMFWATNKEWYTFKPGSGLDGYSLRPDAPEEAKKSFAEWKKQKDKN